MSKWKIDFYDSSLSPFGLYHMIAQETIWSYAKWKLIDRFSTREEAIKLYEKIKDLPEYLS